MSQDVVHKKLTTQSSLLVTVLKMAKTIGWSKTPGANVGVTRDTSKWPGTRVTIVVLLLMDCILLFEFDSNFV